MPASINHPKNKTNVYQEREKAHMSCENSYLIDIPILV